MLAFAGKFSLALALAPKRSGFGITNTINTRGTRHREYALVLKIELRLDWEVSLCQHDNFAVRDSIYLTFSIS